MLDEALQRMCRALTVGSSEDAAWIGVAAQAARTGTWPRPPGGAPALAAVLGRHPQQADLVAWWLELHGLQAVGDPGSAVGLPARVQRGRDQVRMRLVPGDPAFYLDECPVTVAAYRRFVEATRRRPPDSWREMRRYMDRPVVLVTRDDARAYASWAGARLPSRDEWTRAAYGGDGRAYPWGEAPPDADLACFASRGGPSRHWSQGLPVPGSRPEGAGPHGHLDLVGTVWEWCRDTAAEDEAEEDDEGRAPSLGGSFASTARDLVRGVVTWSVAESRHPDLGFRPALGLGDPGPGEGRG